jgi:hypothetical protein
VAATGWTKFVTKEIDRWKTILLRWIPKIGHGGILLYEDLLQDKENQFRHLMRYLGLEVDERRLDCVIKHDFSSFKRNSTRSTRNETIRLLHWQNICEHLKIKFRHSLRPFNRDPFNSVLKGIVDKEIQIVQKALTDYGYELKLTKE